MDGILTLMQRALDESPLAVAFDADGTLWSGDVGEDTILAAIRHHALRREASSALSDLAARYGIGVNADPNRQAELLFDGYHRHQLPEVEACEMMAWAFAGWQEDELRQFVASALQEVGLERRRFRPLERAVDWARHSGLRTVVVSASPDFVIEVAAGPLGFRAEDIAACRPARRHGALLSTLESPLPYGEHKVGALRTLAPGHSLLAAFGDNSFDLPMLRAARVGVAVRPKPALRALLSSAPELVVLES